MAKRDAEGKRKRGRALRKSVGMAKRADGRRQRGFSAALCVRMQIPVRFAAGRHLFVTHSRPYTAADSMEHTRSRRLHVVPDFQFLFLLGHLRERARPPTLSLSYPLPPFASFSLEFPSDLGDHVPCHNYLPPSSRSGTFVPADCTAAAVAVAAACCCRLYFSINYAAVREPYPNDLTANHGDS